MLKSIFTDKKHFHSSYPDFISRRHTCGVSCGFFASPNYYLSGDIQGNIVAWDIIDRDIVLQIKNQNQLLKGSKNSVVSVCSTHAYKPQCLEEIIVCVFLNVSYVCSTSILKKIPMSCFRQRFHGQIELWNLTKSIKSSCIHLNTSHFTRFCYLEHDLHGSATETSCLYLTTSATHDSAYLYDLKRTRSCHPLIKLPALVPEKIPGFTQTSSVKSSGWVAGIHCVSMLGPSYVLLVYEGFALQALFDLRQPKGPVTSPVCFPQDVQTTISSSVTRNQCWIGTAEGNIITTEIESTGQLCAKEKINVYEPVSSLINDHLEYKKELKESMQSQCKFGISDIVFTPDTTIGLAGGWDGQWRCFDVATRDILSTTPYHSQPISCINLEKENGVLAIASHDSRISFWKTAWRAIAVEQ
ncbi:uncharacterized protein LOC128883656 isoform X2 [Hylaeus volcanicus]|uniref:uncharacterized protein LOC128883656 isoform X2 n=1 Tax=Hylaeus volcanicus TaxID=313075 RepID=UPI0023B7F9EC|nr:uncharacterized protein LOC128883656 isoform X2 [Hylaeus volcanicus]